MARKSLVFAAVFAAFFISFCTAPLVRGQGDFVFRGGLESLIFTGENSAMLRLKVAGFDAEVRVPENTRIRSASGQALTLLELAVGSSLEVTADWIDGAFTASVLTVPEDEQVGAVGIIDLLLPERLVISGTEFLLDENSGPLAGQLTTGQMAAVLRSVTWNGSLLANQIVSQEQFWIFGRIHKKDDAAKTITILSRDIVIGDSTKILGADKSLLTFSSLAAGNRVSVTGKTAAGKLTADEVRVVEINGRVEIRGQVISSTTGSITIKSIDTPFVIFKDAQTEVVGTITPGTMVSITATLQSDATLVAQRIVSKAGTSDGKPGETGFVGMLENIDVGNRVLKVQGLTVRLANGAVLRSGEKDILITELKTGDKVKVTGTKQADGSFLATKIDVMAAQPISGTGAAFDGTIESIVTSTDSTKIIVSKIAVLISATTVVLSGDKTITAKDLKVGDKVKVYGTKQADGSYAATKIVVITAAPPPVDAAFEGIIASIAGDGKSLVAGGNTVLISATTVIYSGSKVITVSDLKVGDKVKVKGQKLAEGKYSAALIYLLTPAPAK